MKAIQTGHTFKIYDNSMLTHDQLPAQSYLCCFNKMTGFYLQKYSDIEVNEKVYGIHSAKANKVMNAFHDFNRNLGVILSGDKGIGKSLFSKVLAIKAINEGYPLIIVNSYIPGIADFLDSIQQEVMILFDEFDKTFAGDKENQPQNEMLTLFDGISQGKKLFVVTCNDLNNMNSYFVNRPGRFHYHLRFDYPTAEEIREYMMDKLNEGYYGEIDKVINFSKKINLNYDCLRAITFELNRGLGFEEAISDLNIIRTSGERYTIILTLDNGEKLKTNKNMDLWSDSEETVEFEDEKSGYDVLYCTFTPSNNIFDRETLNCMIKGDNIELEVESYLTRGDDEITHNLYEKYKNVKPVSLVFHRRKEKNIHYYTV